MTDVLARSQAQPVATVLREPGREERDPRRYRRRRKAIEHTLAVAVPLALLGMWQLAAHRKAINTRYFPAPSTIWTSGVDLIRDGVLVDDMIVSFRRVMLGFLIGSITGVASGILLGASRLARAALEPTIYALWTVPKLALLPLLLLIFGLGEAPIVVLIAINCYFLLLIPTIAAIASVGAAYREAADAFGATSLEELRHVLLPAAIPQIFVALRLAAGASILVMVGAEFVQGDDGLGHLIWHSWQLFMADRMYVGIAVVAVSGALFTMLIAAIGRRLTPWDTTH
jgi:NitT/TauT family transport system permease protein/sulfonate transport system permease protein